jgi:hypothetical protein
MYLHLGQSTVVPYRDVVGIFDMDNASWAFKTREFLEFAEQEGRVIWLCDDLPRSFVVTDNGSENWQVFVTQLSSAALQGRAERNSFVLDNE